MDGGGGNMPLAVSFNDDLYLDVHVFYVFVFQRFQPQGRCCIVFVFVRVYCYYYCYYYCYSYPRRHRYHHHQRMFATT